MSSSISSETPDGVLYISCLDNDTDRRMGELESAFITKDRKKGHYVEKIVLTEQPVKTSSKREPLPSQVRFQQIQKIVVVSHHSFYDDTTKVAQSLANRTIGGVNINTVADTMVEIIRKGAPIAEIIFYNCELGLSEPLPIHLFDPSTTLSSSPSTAAPPSAGATMAPPQMTNLWMLQTETEDSPFEPSLKEPREWDCFFGQEHSNCIQSLITSPGMCIHVSTLAYITHRIFMAIHPPIKPKGPQQDPHKAIVIKGLNGIGFISKADGKLWSFNSSDFPFAPVGVNATAHKEREFHNTYVAPRNTAHVIAYHINHKGKKPSKRLYPPLYIKAESLSPSEEKDSPCSSSEEDLA